MTVDPLERLRAANPEPWCPPPPIDEVWRRIEADPRLAQDGVVARPGGLAALGVRLRSLGGVMLALSSVAVVVAVVAIALLAHGRSTSAGDSGGAQQLIARLAVLRRPQTAADVLPSRLHIASPLSPPGTIVPRLTRLVRTLPDARLYLAVTTWSPDSIWSPRLGDQVSIVEISGSHATQTMPVPAADLTNANEVFPVAPTRQRFPTQPGAYFVGIVPDGVARVSWTFPNKQFRPGAVLDLSVAGNVAVTRARPDTFLSVLRAAWYTPDGQRVATSNQALLAAEAAHDAPLKAQAIRNILQHPYHADPSLLAAFAVFDITSPTGVKTAAGDIISRPPLSSLPLAILQGYVPPPCGPRIEIPRTLCLLHLDFTEVRQVITPSGVRLYVIPGAQGLCVHTIASSPFPDRFGGGFGGCDPDLADAEAHGTGFGGASLGVTITGEIVPKTIHRITIHTSRGTRTIPVPDGVYASTSRQTGR